MIIVDGHCYLYKVNNVKRYWDSARTSCVSCFSFAVVAVDETLSKLAELRISCLVEVIGCKLHD